MYVHAVSSFYKRRHTMAVIKLTEGITDKLAQDSGFFFFDVMY